MFLTIKKKVLVCVVMAIIVVVTTVGVFFCVQATSSKPNLQKVIVIDAGHGGREGGAVGENSIESELNLQYALALQGICNQFGFNVVMTRDDMAGLYSPLASNKKRSEMEKRIEIIQNANPDLVVSIHMNSFSSDEARGSQVFYG